MFFNVFYVFYISLVVFCFSDVVWGAEELGRCMHEVYEVYEGYEVYEVCEVYEAYVNFVNFVNFVNP